MAASCTWNSTWNSSTSTNQIWRVGRSSCRESRFNLSSVSTSSSHRRLFSYVLAVSIISFPRHQSSWSAIWFEIALRAHVSARHLAGPLAVLRFGVAAVKPAPRNGDQWFSYNCTFPYTWYINSFIRSNLLSTCCIFFILLGKESRYSMSISLICEHSVYRGSPRGTNSKFGLTMTNSYRAQSAMVHPLDVWLDTGFHQPLLFSKR